MRIEDNSRLVNYHIPLILFHIALIWKLFFIEYRDICIDEPFTIFNAQKSIGDIIGLSTSSEPNPPLFMLLIHFWIQIFGISPVSVRFLPLLFNAVTVVFIYFTGKRFFSLWTGLMASGLFLLSSLHFLYGLNTRTYSLVALETAAALYFFLRYAHNMNDRKALAGLIVSNILLVYSHYFGWFVILTQVISSLFYVRNMKSFFRFMIPAVATFIGFIPMLPSVFSQFLAKSDHGTWLTHPDAKEYLRQIYRFLNFKTVLFATLVVMGLGVIFTLVSVMRRRWNGFNKDVPVLLLWWLLPYSIMFIISVKLPIFNNSYNLFHTIGLYLFLGAAINFLFQKNRIIEPVMGLAVVIFMGVNLRILPEDFAYREVKNSVEYVKRYKDANSVVILYPYWSELPFAYYYDRELFSDHQNFRQRLKEEGVYPVWGLPGTKQVMEWLPPKDVIYMQDGEYRENDWSIFSYFDTTLVRRDSAFFPQTIKVGVYELRP